MHRSISQPKIYSVCLFLFLNLLASVLPMVAQAKPYTAPTVGTPERRLGGGTRGGSGGRFNPGKPGLPGRRQGGGTRGDCILPPGGSDLVALIPQQNLGLTAAEYPRFFWFAPATKARLAEFELYDVDDKLQNRNLIYKTTFSITGKAGVASLKLPSDATIPPLAQAQPYRWSVTLVCDSNNRKRDLSVNGWIERVSLSSDVRNQLRSLSWRDRLSVYESENLWFDAVALLAEQRACKSDTTLLDSWTDLFAAVNLQAIAQKPLLQQCPNPESLGE